LDYVFAVDCAGTAVEERKQTLEQRWKADIAIADAHIELLEQARTPTLPISAPVTPRPSQPRDPISEQQHDILKQRTREAMQSAGSRKQAPINTIYDRVVAPATESVPFNVIHELAPAVTFNETMLDTVQQNLRGYFVLENVDSPICGDSTINEIYRWIKKHSHH